MRALKEDLMVY